MTKLNKMPSTEDDFSEYFNRLNEAGETPSYRGIARLLGCSHTSILKRAKKIGIKSPADLEMNQVSRDFKDQAKDKEMLEYLSEKGYLLVKETSKAIKKIKVEVPTKSLKIGYLSDTHYGSRWQNDAIIDAAYESFKKEKVSAVVHAGDFFEGSGKVYKGQLHEMFLYGIKPQINYALNVHPYPSIKGVKTYVISGNHDLSFLIESGIDPVEELCSKRDDLVFLGRNSGELDINGFRIRAHHGRGGLPKSISLKAQQAIEAMPSPLPHVLLLGHWHHHMYYWHKNTAVIMAGTTQGTTPFIDSLMKSAMCGWGILELGRNKDDMLEFSSKYTRVPEGKEIR